jgi:hypothetical protein
LNGRLVAREGEGVFGDLVAEMLAHLRLREHASHPYTDLVAAA